MCIVADSEAHTHYSYSLEVHCTIVKCVKHRSRLLHKPISVGFISGLIDMKSTGARAGDVFTPLMNMWGFCTALTHDNMGDRKHGVEMWGRAWRCWCTTLWHGAYSSSDTTLFWMRRLSSEAVSSAGGEEEQIQDWLLLLIKENASCESFITYLSKWKPSGKAFFGSMEATCLLCRVISREDNQVRFSFWVRPECML